MKYYKIIDTKKGNRGLFYKEGYNEDPKPFIPSEDCEPGGIYFAREDILKFIGYGDTVCEVEPIGEVCESPGTPKKWKAHAINLKFIGKWTDLKVMRKLIKEGADIHTGNDFALRYTAENGLTEVAKLLLKAGADVHALKDYALQYAALNGHTETVKLLLKAGADVHSLDDLALRYAARHLRVYKYVGIVKLLLGAKADANALDNWALSFIAQHLRINGHTKTVKLLLEAGADVHALNDYALQYAALNGHTETVKVLLEVGTNVHSLDDLALRYAARYSRAYGPTKTVKLLLEAGADVHIYNDYIFKESIALGDVEAVKIFLQHKTHAYKIGKKEFTFAKKNTDKQVLEMLLEAKKAGKVEINA